jgi:repressor LexA
MLTRKQHELLLFINKRLSDSGISPSFDEMKDALKLRSKSGIHRLITALEERGFIARLPHRARALEVRKLPEAAALREGTSVREAARDEAPRRFEPNVITGRFQTIAGASPVAQTAAAITLPLYGKIAAGRPIEALRDPTNYTDIPAGSLSKNEHFALEVSGDSMLDAGILDGDTAVIERSDTAENGSIVVALVDNEEVTLKRLRRKGNSIALEPANKAYETRILPADRVRIQGRLVMLIRKY